MIWRKVEREYRARWDRERMRETERERERKGAGREWEEEERDREREIQTGRVIEIDCNGVLKASRVDLIRTYTLFAEIEFPKSILTGIFDAYDICWTLNKFIDMTFVRWVTVRCNG